MTEMTVEVEQTREKKVNEGGKKRGYENFWLRNTQHHKDPYFHMMCSRKWILKSCVS